MEHDNSPQVTACWHCGAPVQARQAACVTCGASAERRPEEFSPIALAEIIGDRYEPFVVTMNTAEMMIHSAGLDLELPRPFSPTRIH